MGSTAAEACLDNTHEWNTHFSLFIPGCPALLCLSFLTGEASCEESAIKLSEMLRDMAVIELGSTPPSHLRSFRSTASDTDVGIRLARRWVCVLMLCLVSGILVGAGHRSGAERGLSRRRTGSSIYMVSVSHYVAKKGQNIIGEPRLIK